jgi:hypothetical protein
MNSALSLSRSFSSQAYLGKTMRSPSAAVSGLIAIVLSCTVFMVNKPAVAVPVASPAVAEPAPATENAGIARTRNRCEACGVVETMHRTEASGDLPAAYEFTVRLRDGSSRMSSDANPGKWRIGDHVMLIGGVSAPRN